MAQRQNSQPKLKTVNIHGKAYTQVFTRINFFRGSGEDGLVWEGGKGKDWSIEVDPIVANDTYAHMKAVIKDETGRTRATGQAMETKGSSNINKTSHVENCETSAIGRALGNLGIGTAESFASTDEVSMAIAQQAVDKLKTAEAEIETLQMQISQLESQASGSFAANREALPETWIPYFITKMQAANTVEEADAVLAEFTSFSNDPEFVRNDDPNFSTTLESVREGVPVNLPLGAISAIQKAYCEKVSFIQQSTTYCNVLHGLQSMGDANAIMSLFKNGKAGSVFTNSHQARIRESLNLFEFLKNHSIDDQSIHQAFPFLFTQETVSA